MRTSDEMFIGANCTHPDKDVKYKVTAIANPSGTASDSPAFDSVVANDSPSPGRHLPV
jgi:hypothetical protein